MQELEIETYLANLGQELQTMGVTQPIRILMVGGAYMLTQIHNRVATQDVDVLLKDIDDPTTSPLYPMLLAAVRAVANQHQIPATWFNDVVGDALRNNGPVPEGSVWRIYGMLEIYIPDAEYILALKLLAGRPRDNTDIQSLVQQLGIVTREQAQEIVDRYIPDQQFQQLNHVDMTLDRVFP